MKPIIKTNQKHFLSFMSFVQQVSNSKEACGLVQVQTRICNYNPRSKHRISLSRNLICLLFLLSDIQSIGQSFGSLNNLASLVISEDSCEKDTESPVAICQDVYLQLDETCGASITAANIDSGSTDNCGIASLSLDIMDFTPDNEGENTVVLTITDSFGNFSTCTGIVTVFPFLDFPPCIPVIDIDAAFLANDPHESDFHAWKKVIANGLITSPEVISFKAGYEVQLRPVFEVEQGAVLTIDIGPCVLEKWNTNNLSDNSLLIGEDDNLRRRSLISLMTWSKLAYDLLKIP
ncbi:MAG: hypothetical protein IPL46_21225 [Saprospiraceae bacterium]|nr:hypothetical protein [Saprospiraceae bacterium]